jgi:hypothetical protein
MFFDSLTRFSVWLEQTQISEFLQDVTWIIPAVQSIHIFCVALVMASIGMLDLRLMGVAGTRVSISGMAERFLPWIWWPVVVLLVTGTILITAEPKRDLPNFVFQMKMALLVTALIVTFFFQRAVRRDANFWDLSPAHRHSAKVTAGISIVLWVGIVFCGRFIAYVGMER